MYVDLKQNLVTDRVESYIYSYMFVKYSIST